MQRLTNWLPHLLLFPYVLVHALVALMDRDGKVWPVVTGQVVNWAGWNASGDSVRAVGHSPYRACS